MTPKSLADADIAFDIISHLQPDFVIIAGSILEDLLTQALERGMRKDLSARMKARIFNGYGPLSSFSAKIDVAYAMSFFEFEIFNDLRAIKDIRNEFAHATDFLNFSSLELQPKVQKLTGWQRDCDADALFKTRFKACVDALNKHLRHQNLIQAITEYRQPDASPDTTGEQSHPHPFDLDESEGAK